MNANAQSIQEIDAATAQSSCLTCSQRQAAVAYAAQQGTQSAAASQTGMAVPQTGMTVSAAGPAGSAAADLSQAAPITDTTQPMPMTVESTQYLNGFLRTQIGQRVRVSFLIGTNSFLDQSGKLLEVGANYILLQQAMTDDLLVCDFYTIKFVTIYR